MATKGKDMAVWGLESKRLKRRVLAMLSWLLDPVQQHSCSSDNLL